MTYYHTCVGCHRQGMTCEARDKMREALKGLSVRSVKWHCRERKSLYVPGDPVWALTVWNYGDTETDLRGLPERCRDYFPATVVKPIGHLLLVYIQDGAEGRGDFGDGSTFKAEGANGFCKIPLSRIEHRRDAPRLTICKWCERPESMVHPDGYPCSADRAFAAADPLTYWLNREGLQSL